MTKPTTQGEIRIPKTLGAEKEARERVRLLGGSMGFSEERIEDIMTAVGEACLNAIEHGSSGDPTDTVLVRFDPGPGALEVLVSSKGAPFAFSYVEPDIRMKIEGNDRPRGWGLFLIRRLADGVEISSEGDVTTVKMKFLLQPKQRP